jgi:hypothetical protein
MKSRRVGVTGVLHHPVADRLDPRESLQLFVGEGLVEALGREVEVEPFRQERQFIDVGRQVVVGRLLVFRFGQRPAGHREHEVRDP